MDRVPGGDDDIAIGVLSFQLFAGTIHRFGHVVHSIRKTIFLLFSGGRYMAGRVIRHGLAACFEILREAFGKDHSLCARMPGLSDDPSDNSIHGGRRRDFAVLHTVFSPNSVAHC
jgi:hypothetical protein